MSMSDKFEVLDVGCGYREGTTQRGQVHVDIDKPAKPCRKIKNFVLADAHFLPFRSGAFSQAYFMEVIEHVRSPSECLHEICRVLRVRGYIIISTPNPLHYRNCFYALRGKSPHDDNAEHICTFLACNIESLFAQVGFRVMKTDWLKLCKVTHHNWFDTLFARILPHVIGGCNLVVIGRKFGGQTNG